jgi:aminopeptidase N
VDEPAAKARFDVTLFVDPVLQAVSNMPATSKTTTAHSEADSAAVNRGLTYAAGMARYTYATSPIMSTYLLAFIVVS